jgi:hypothetical protein
MSNEHENTIYGSYGEFDPYGTDEWTDEDWAEYDAQVAEDMALHDEMMDAYWPEPWDFDPPF